MLNIGFRSCQLCLIEKTKIDLYWYACVCVCVCVCVFLFTSSKCVNTKSKAYLKGINLSHL